jgi:hypothetical protein
MGPNRFHQKRTVSWLISIPRSAKRSSTLRSESGYLTYIMTTRRMTSGELLGISERVVHGPSLSRPETPKAFGLTKPPTKPVLLTGASGKPALAGRVRRKLAISWRAAKSHERVGELAVNAPATTIAVPGLTHLEADELATTLRDAGADPDSDLDVQSEGGDGEDRYNEPFTLLAVMALSQITMTALAIYLSKGSTRSRMKVYLRHRRPDGEEIEYTLEVDTSSQEATKADLLKQIVALKIPLPEGLDLGSSSV